MLGASRPFVVFSLPRSRSTWLSVFLSRPEARCGHDIGPTLDHPEDFAERLCLGGLVGTCETGAAFAWRFIRQQIPEAQFVVLRRDPAKVVRSLEVLGIKGQEGEMWGRARDLDVISAQPGTITLESDHLAKPYVCAELYKALLGRSMSPGWWAQLDATNIQVDINRALQLLMERRPQIEALKAAVRAMQDSADA